MNGDNYITLIHKNNLTEQTKFRLDEIIGIEIIFIMRLTKENHILEN